MPSFPTRRASELPAGERVRRSAGGRVRSGRQGLHRGQAPARGRHRLLRHGDPGDPGRAVVDGGAEGLDRGSAVRDPRGLTRRGADRAPDPGALSMQTQLRISRSCDLMTSTSPGTASAPTGTVALEPAKSRSEEHTSELQSLMRISYAVFCLIKTTHQ